MTLVKLFFLQQLLENLISNDNENTFYYKGTWLIKGLDENTDVVMNTF